MKELAISVLVMLIDPSQNHKLNKKTFRKILKVRVSNRFVVVGFRFTLTSFPHQTLKAFPYKGFLMILTLTISIILRCQDKDGICFRKYP